MEVVLKILNFLCLSSVTIGSRLAPSINIKTPIGLEFGIGAVSTNHVDNVSSKTVTSTSNKHCFCIPHNAKSKPVKSLLDSKNNDIERLAVFFYKRGKTTHVYIPNQKKQRIIPELDFDEIEGDILKQISSEIIDELFNPIIYPQHQHRLETFHNEVVHETVDLEGQNQQPINTNSDKDQQLLENIDYSSLTTSEEHNSIEDDTPFFEENVLHLQAQSESINEPELNDITKDFDQLQPIASVLPSESQAIVNPADELDTTRDLNDFHQSHQTFTTTPHKLPSEPNNQVTDAELHEINIVSALDDAIEQHPVTPNLPSSLPHAGIIPGKLNQPNFDNTKIVDNSGQLHQNLMPPTLPHKLQPYVIKYPGIDKISNLDVFDQLRPTSSVLPSVSQTSGSSATVHDHKLNINTDFGNTAQLNTIIPIMPSKSEQVSSDQKKLSEPVLANVQDVNGFKPSLQSLQSYEVTHPMRPIESEQLRKMLFLLPSKYQPYLQVPIQEAPYLTFYDWFEDQLRRVAVYNLETPTNVIALRERIKTVLHNNGMQIDVNGIVFDLNGNLVQMNNIKLQPILIYSTPFNLHNSQNYQKYAGDPAVSYIQLIEITGVKPPTLLGTLMMGTVQLPKHVNTSLNVKVIGTSDQVENQISSKRPNCLTCKQNIHDRYANVYPPMPYGQYYGLPFRRQFETDKKTLKGTMTSQLKPIPIANATPQRRNNGDMNKNVLGGVFEGLLGNFGISPTLFANPSRRLLGGRVIKGPRPSINIYPNDVLPGYRIVGGNAATSSGTPLVSKGRSGYEKPIIIT